MENDRDNRKPRVDRRGAQENNAPRDRKALKAERPASKIEDSNDGRERIAKRLARAGIASRRDAEMMIIAGRIAVNGKTLNTPAFNVDRGDVITVDGKPLPPIERTRLWLYHKRAGLVTTNRDPEGRPTVFDNLPNEMPRVLSVGRLDINTEGLLLLTNDGGLARVLELPSTGWVRKYRVRAHGKISQDDLDALKNGIAINGIFYGAVEAILEREQGSNVWLSVALREGKNREVKNILGALGLTVTRLIRVSFGPFQLADLEEGAVRELKGRTLRDQLGERLIEEANANFDLPIIKPFSNAPVIAENRSSVKPNVSDDGWISSSPAAPRFNKRGKKVDFSERGRAQLTTKPERWNEKRNTRLDERAGMREKSADGKTEMTTPRSRSTNVWMAPGARPQTARKKFWRNRENTDEFVQSGSKKFSMRTTTDESNKSRRDHQNVPAERDDFHSSRSTTERFSGHRFKSKHHDAHAQSYNEKGSYKKRQTSDDRRETKAQQWRRRDEDGRQSDNSNARGYKRNQSDKTQPKKQWSPFREKHTRKSEDNRVRQENVNERSDRHQKNNVKKGYNRPTSKMKAHKQAGGFRADRRR